MSRQSRTAAALGVAGLACTGLAAAPTALAAEDPACAVSYTTTLTGQKGAPVNVGLPKEIDFGPRSPAAAGYTVTFHGRPSRAATGFVRAQVVINGNTPAQTDGFDWKGRSPIAGDGSVSVNWKPNPAQFTAGRNYSLDHNDSHAVENDAAGDLCLFRSIGPGSFFYAKGQTQVPGVTFTRHGSKLTIVASTQRFVLAAGKFLPRAEPVQLYASTTPSGARGHLVATGTTNAAGKFAFHVTSSKKLTYYVIIPTTAFGTTSSSRSYSA